MQCITGLSRSFRSSLRLSVCLFVRLLVGRKPERTRNACREQKTAIPTRFKSVSSALGFSLSLSPSPFLCPYSFLSPSLSRFLPLSVRASSGSEFSLHPALLILLFLACCLCPCLGRCWSLVRPPSAARRARENISWPSGGSAEAFSQLAVMARPAASVSAN